MVFCLNEVRILFSRCCTGGFRCTFSSGADGYDAAKIAAKTYRSVHIVYGGGREWRKKTKFAGNINIIP